MPPVLNSLPKMLPIEGAVRIELEEGVPIFRATDVVRWHSLFFGESRIQDLLYKQQSFVLSEAEEEDLDSYEEINNYLSFVNRTVRNLFVADVQQAS